MTSIEGNLTEETNQYNWLDIFFGVLIKPIETFDAISNVDLYSSRLTALFGSMLIVLMVAIVDGCAGQYSFAADALVLSIIGAVFADLFFWFVLAIFARLLAAVMKVNMSMRSCLTVCGWSFVPLLLKASTRCFSNVTQLGDILSLLIALWFLVLVIFAFDSLLKLGKLKTVAFVLFLPPCLFFSYLISMIFANKFIIDGFF